MAKVKLKLLKLQIKRYSVSEPYQRRLNSDTKEGTGFVRGLGLDKGNVTKGVKKGRYTCSWRPFPFCYLSKYKVAWSILS